MDTLLTAFLSSGMQHTPHQTSFKIPGQSWIDKDNINCIIPSVDNICMKSLITKDKEYPWQYYKMTARTTGFQQFGNPELATEIDINPLANTEVSGTEAPYSSYLTHQMYHKLKQKRISSLIYIAARCCLKLGCMITSEHSDLTPHDCCTEMANQNIHCACEKLQDGNRCCNLHNLYIQNMKIINNSISWTVTYLKNDSCNYEISVANPIYDIPMESANFVDISTDSFEIEFSSHGSDTETVFELDSNYLQGFTFHIHGGSEGSNDDDSEGDDESLVYETSDDEDDDEYCFYSFEVEPVESMSCDGSGIFHEEISATLDVRVNTSKQKNISKYHQKCICGMENEPSKNNTKNNNNQKKKVSFTKDVEVHHLIAWKHAYNQSRKSFWVKIANDRAHFLRRIQNVEKVLDPILRSKLEHC